MAFPKSRQIIGLFPLKNRTFSNPVPQLRRIHTRLLFKQPGEIKQGAESQFKGNFLDGFVGHRQHILCFFNA